MHEAQSQSRCWDRPVTHWDVHTNAWDDHLSHRKYHKWYYDIFIIAMYWFVNMDTWSGWGQKLVQASGQNCTPMGHAYHYLGPSVTVKTTNENSTYCHITIVQMYCYGYMDTRTGWDPKSADWAGGLARRLDQHLAPPSVGIHICRAIHCHSVCMDICHIIICGIACDWSTHPRN